MSSTIKDIERTIGNKDYPESADRLTALYQERDGVAKELKEAESDLLYRCRVLEPIEKAMVVDKIIKGLSNKRLADKYMYSHGAIRNKMSKILKRIGMSEK